MNGFQVREQIVVVVVFLLGGGSGPSTCYPYVISLNMPEIKFIQAFTHVLVTSNFDDDSIKKLARRHHFQIFQGS